MRSLTIDGFVLRFPRTGIVNYAYNIIAGLIKDPSFDITVLLQDLNFTHPELANFAKSLRYQLVETNEFDQLIYKIRRLTVDKGLSVDLPLPRMINRATKSCDIYHCTDWYNYASRHAKKNVITCFDLTTTLFPDYHERTNIVKEARKANSFRKFDIVVAISESTKRDLVENFGISADKVKVSHLGVDSVYEHPNIVERDEFLDRYKIGTGKRYILSVSTIEPRKNIVGILQSYRRFCERNPNRDDVMLVLSGPMGWRNDGLKIFLDEYPYRDRIVFTGYVQLSDMPSLYRHAECFMYLSFYEGFGIPILEAMKSSCPVICSNTSSMPEVIGDSGELVAPDSTDQAAEALERVLNNPAHANGLRASGLRRSKMFSWDKHIDDLTEIYKEV